ncbi:MAG: hypothetical protein JRN06_02355 [Nitrososphaerota archaeon]|nr:hypothetical protein [Nitrososphaerota archaeon]MDG7023302.1 hypothetical protein [Nitrososphaerota archaeon]
MTESDDSQARRELITKLLPFVAVSAIRLGMATSPLVALSSAVERYNTSVGKTKAKADDLLALLPGIERLRMEVLTPGEVALVLQRQDIVNCAEQYLRTVFVRDGSKGAMASPARAIGGEAQFDSVLRLPSKSVYLKSVSKLSQSEASKFLEAGRELNPAEVWIFADEGAMIDEHLDPVFISENKVMSGRVKSVLTADMLSELFGHRFAVSLGEKTDREVNVTLRLVE